MRKRNLPIVALTLVLAASLPSCGRGADTPPASSQPTADTAAPAPAPPPPPPPPRELTWSGKVDMKLWSVGRVKAYKVALERETPRPLAILRIDRLMLEVPVYDGTSDAVLDLAAGRIDTRLCPGRRATSASRPTVMVSSGCCRTSRKATRWCWTRQSRPSTTASSGFGSRLLTTSA